MNETRRLSTILFADIAGYTAIMQSDETKALAYLQSFKKTMEQVVPENQGQIIQFFGDGCLLSFDSTSQGVRCAMALQEIFQKEALPVRMGIHLGEVVFSENNAYGDGVNIASRIESMGVSGAVLLSSTVRDQIKNKSEFELSSLGAFEFKNVEEPLQVFAISNPGFTVPDRQDLKGKFKEPLEKKQAKRTIPVFIAVGIIALLALLYKFVPGLKNASNPTESSKLEARMAVMPFQNLSSDESDLHYCNGVMQNVVDNLSRIPEFIVLPSRTTNRYKDSELLPTELGEELGVDYLIDGTFQKIGNEIQVTVALTRTQDGRQIWTNEKATFSLPELFAMQAQVANQVASQLKITLSPQLSSAFETLPTRDEVAYEYYLRGEETLKNYDEEIRSREENIKALSDANIYFDLAVERDSSFADAYLGLAKIEYHKDKWANVLKDSTLFEYKALVDKALRLNPELAEGYSMRGTYFLEELRQPEEAEKDYLKSLDINPNNIDALYGLVDLYTNFKLDIIESISLLKELEYRTADEQELYRIYHDLSRTYDRLMDRQMIEYYVDKRIALNDRYPDETIPWFYVIQNEPEKALADLKKRFPDPDNQFQLALYGSIHNQMGRFEEAVKYFERWEKLLDFQDADNWLSVTDWHRYGQALVKAGQDSLGIALIRKQLAINKELLKKGQFWKSYDTAGIYSFLNIPDSVYYYIPDFAVPMLYGGTGYFLLKDYQFDNIRSQKRFIDQFETAKAKMLEIRKQVHTVDPDAPEVN